MLIYKCRKCGKLIYPEGKGCDCGESWGSLEDVYHTKDEYFDEIKDAIEKLFE
jgi:uncharacterized OB-fold protein